MQAVILAGGLGKRLRPVTETVPKPLVPINGRPILEYALDRLPEDITEIVFVIGYKGDMLREAYGDSVRGRNVSYAVQEEPLGTAHAMRCAAPFVHGPFLLLYGDGVYGREGLTKILQHDFSLLAHRVSNPEQFGVLVCREDGTLERTVEKPKEFVSNLTWVGAAKLPASALTLDVPRSPRGEYEATDVFNLLLQGGHVCRVEETDFWLTANTKDEISKVEEGLLDEKAVGSSK